MNRRTRSFLREIPTLLLITYGFFLSISFMGGGMKASFKEPLHAYLTDHAADFTELVSFVIGVLGTSVVQSSSTVTSMAVTLAAEGIVPMIIAIGIVHGANLGTSVTSSLVAFMAETRPLSGHVVRDLRSLLFDRRLPGFHRAVSTAVVHGMFNAILVTLIVLTLEIPFGLIHHTAEYIAGVMTASVQSSATVVAALEVVTPGAWTKPVTRFLLGAGLPGWTLVVLGFALLFACLKGFSSRMKGVLLAGTDAEDVEAMGRTLLGTHPADTFLRGLVLTMLVQSSSATTSLVVPLAGMGFFTVRQIFPFVMGANIGTTVTALMAATAAFGTEGFHAGMTIALCHFLLNTLAVVLVWTVPGLYTSVLGCTEWLADHAAAVPAVLLGYLAMLAVVLPVAVYVLPTSLAWGILAAVVAGMLIGPHIYLRRKAARREAVGNAV
jgi:sodium-dependent phosphate cotransporter